MSTMDAFELSIAGAGDLATDDLNKVPSGAPSLEGITGEKMDVLELPMTDEELLKLKNEWESQYIAYESKMKETFKRNLRSYLGRTKDGFVPDENAITAANLQFEAEETFIPAATAQEPDPIVFADNTPEGNAMSDAVKTMLQYHAQQLLLRRKLALMVRHWSIYHLAVIKLGWDMKINDISVENRKVQNFIFDINGYVDVFGHFSSYLGERIEVTAEKLIELFPTHKDYIKTMVDGKMGTNVIYTEWWSDEFCFTTFKQKVLDKHKNEFFNYPEKVEVPDPLTGELVEQEEQTKRNHFATPKKPYIFLSVYSLQNRPHDLTSLIEQNIPNQNKISKRTEQIDINVSKSNNSELYSANNFNQETAKQAARAIEDPSKGQVLVPQGGPIGESVVRLQAPSFPDAAFKDLENSENHLRNSWGTQGLAAENPSDNKDTTARGMVLNQGRDTSRIGGGVVDILEQSVARSVFDYEVQLYMVFYDEKHFAAVMGVGKAMQYAQLQSADIDRQLVIGVAMNSMQPKDETSEANMAQALFDKGAIGPKTLLETVNFRNADEAAADGLLYRLDPMTYMRMNFPEQFQALQQAMMEQQQAQQAQAQQELQQQQAQGDQKLQQSGQAHQQKIVQGAQAHEQKLQQGQEMNKAKANQFKELASAKLSAQKTK